MILYLLWKEYDISAYINENTYIMSMKNICEEKGRRGYHDGTDHTKGICKN